MASIGNNNLLENWKGIRNAKDALVVLVKTEWNASIVDKLETGCKRILDEHGVSYHTLVVPGAIEIPFAIQQTKKYSNRVSAFIALGCVIRGDTPHFEYVCQSVTQGISELNIKLDVPVIFGVLTVNNIEQAEERTGGIHGHKGEEAAVTALKMIAIQQQLIEGNI